MLVKHSGSLGNLIFNNALFSHSSRNRIKQFPLFFILISRRQVTTISFSFCGTQCGTQPHKVLIYFSVRMFFSLVSCRISSDPEIWQGKIVPESSGSYNICRKLLTVNLLPASKIKSQLERIAKMAVGHFANYIGKKWIKSSNSSLLPGQSMVN